MAPADATRGTAPGHDPDAVSGPPAQVAVLLPLPLSDPYDYRLPADLAAPPGAFVTVPLGRRELTGVIWGGAQGGVEPARLKDVVAVRDTPPMPASLRRFIEWLADYTLAPRGAVLRMAMSVPAALDPPAGRTAYRLGAKAPTRLTKARARVLALLADGLPRPAADIAREAAVSSAVVRTLAEAGALQILTLPGERAFQAPDAALAGPTLMPAQSAAATALRAAVAADAFAVTLLDGVTGAGKTEVYFEAVAAALAAGRQVLVLLPEIALGAQWLGRFRTRFGVDPAEWHSDLGQRARRETWRGVATGKARVVVGARSALFLPFAELGLIVVDEEHEPAYKQEEGVIYQARDMAVVRGRIEACPVVLASATPSLETVVNAKTGRYQTLRLPTRHGGAQLPAIEAVDMRQTPPPRGGWLSPPLRHALGETLADGAQSVLFLNRRGYAPLTLCQACGHRLQCPNCTAWLVEHRFAGRLACHHCGYDQLLPEQCPACQVPGKLTACGPGVERLAEEVQTLFPEARYAILTSDTIAGPRDAAALIAQVAAHQVDLLIGTQIIAKGHHFPMLTLVGVVDADLGLAGGDLRAAERTYQLLHQVAGRAGREKRPGRVLLQTYAPEDAVMQALVSGDREAFLEREASERKAHGQPPFGRLAAFILSGREEAAVARAARALARVALTGAGRDSGIGVYGPAPAPLALLRGRYRYRLLIKAPRAVRLQPWLRHWRDQLRLPGGVRLQTDVDPYRFL